MVKRLNICSIVGARPQFVKLQPFSEELRKLHNETIIHTGQHYDDNMSNTFFNELNIPEPDYNLDVRSPLQGEQTARMLSQIEKLLIEMKPDAVVVFGDTNSTIAGSLAAVKLHIPTIHIEAGLRSFNRIMPEEINRIVSDHVSDYLFAPTDTAMFNLKKEGLSDKAFLTGDIMVDSLKNALQRCYLNKRLHKLFDKIQIELEEYYLLTLHRPQNVDNPANLYQILAKLNQLDYPIVFPIHPRTMKSLQQCREDFNKLKNIKLIEPQSYLNFILLQHNSKKILTDSGGIQKEAYILKKPCLTIRDETEWVETVTTGWNVLINPESEDFIEKILTHSPAGDYKEVFGNDVAAKTVRLIETLLEADNL